MKYNIDISFIDELLQLVNRDECCIHHDKLKTYEVFIKNTFGQIQDLLNQYELIESEDYNMSNVRQVRNKRGFVIKYEYHLHICVFYK